MTSAQLRWSSCALRGWAVTVELCVGVSVRRRVTIGLVQSGAGSFTQLAVLLIGGLTFILNLTQLHFNRETHHYLP